MELIVSVSGLRGIVGDSLTPEVAIRYAHAFSQVIGPGPVVLTRDGRATGCMLADAIAATLAAVGRDVLDGGPAATPTTGLLVRQHQAAGGIQVSASHNPLPYNGMKLLGADGRVISEERGAQVLAKFQQPIVGWSDHASLGHRRILTDTIDFHLQQILQLVDVDAIRRQAYRVVLDSNHGAGSCLGIPLLRELGCNVMSLGGTPDGQFSHPPEPTAENLAGVGVEVTRHHASIGFCQDPDADRLALLDEHGTYIGEEYTLALCVRHVLQTSREAKSPLGPVVTNCATSRMTEDIVREFGVPVFYSRVGEANVADLMVQKQALFGGEGNGGPIDPRVGYVRDSFVGMAIILHAMAANRLPLSQLVSQIPRYSIHKSKVSLARGDVDAAMDRLKQHFSTAQASTLDGLRLDWSDRWLLIRASNTEPIVRIVAEAPDSDAARKMCEDAIGVLKAG